MNELLAKLNDFMMLVKPNRFDEREQFCRFNCIFLGAWVTRAQQSAKNRSRNVYTSYDICFEAMSVEQGTTVFTLKLYSLFNTFKRFFQHDRGI